MSGQSLRECGEIVKPACVIPLTQGFEAIVDEDDFGRLSRWRWKVLKASPGKFYASRTATLPGRKYATILMHRVIAEAPDGVLVDHRNGNGLDNRRSNLRLCNQTQNLGNMASRTGTSQFKGVYWSREKQLWQAQIRQGYAEDGRFRSRFLGRYESEEDAALAYDRAARDTFGEFALTNFPGDDGREIIRARSSFVPSGDRNPSAKLSAAQASDIKRRALAGENQSAIARDFGVSRKLVSAIKTGVAWKDLP